MLSIYVGDMIGRTEVNRQADRKDDMKPTTIHENLVRLSESSFLSLTTQIDHLFTLTIFYLDRYPSDGEPGRNLQDLEVKKTVDNLASLIGQLSDTIKRWKHGEPRVLSKLGVELNILNEIWANCNALIYFLVSHEIDLEPFDSIRATAAYHALVKCNNLLP